jgi:multisubunit Na+/H+ antiporter MnhB subunit
LKSLISLKVTKDSTRRKNKMVKLIELLSYIASILGILFILLAVISKLYKITDPSGLTNTYPYQFLSLPYFFLGLAFLIGGIAGIWVNYLRYERTKRNESPVFKEDLPIKREPIEEKVDVHYSYKPTETNPVNKSELNYRKIGLVIVIFGTLLLLFAAFAYSYQQTTTQTIPGTSVGGIQITQPYSYNITTTPYQGYTFPLIISSAAFFLLGFAVIFGLREKSP